MFFFKVQYSQLYKNERSIYLLIGIIFLEQNLFEVCLSSKRINIFIRECFTLFL